MQEILQQLQPLLINAFITIVSLVIIYITRKISKYLTDKIENESIDKAILVMENIVRDTVIAIKQEIVDELKKNKKFDKETAKKIKQEALQKVKEKLGSKLVEFLKKHVKDVDKFISDKIEKWVYETKEPKKK